MKIISREIKINPIPTIELPVAIIGCFRMIRSIKPENTRIKPPVSSTSDIPNNLPLPHYQLIYPKWLYLILFQRYLIHDSVHIPQRAKIFINHLPSLFSTDPHNPIFHPLSHVETPSWINLHPPFIPASIWYQCASQSCYGRSVLTQYNRCVLVRSGAFNFNLSIIIIYRWLWCEKPYLTLSTEGVVPF